MPSALSFVVEYNDLNRNHNLLKNHPDMSFIAMFNLEFSTFKHLFFWGGGEDMVQVHWSF